MKNTLLAVLLAGALAASSFGQSLGQINARRVNQQDRIASGIQNGSLNAGEAAHLENREHNLNREIHFDRATDHGHLTRGERVQITHQQNRLSRNIYRDKHN